LARRFDTVQIGQHARLSTLCALRSKGSLGGPDSSE
jgi:hypothetical protein